MNLGASDDVLTCAIMIELVRVLSKLPVRLKHNVVFLFNGAEETPLEVSIKKHYICMVNFIIILNSII